MTADASALASSQVAAVLASILEEPLTVVDVGCRWGFADTWEELGDRCRIVGFEPDRVESERLAEHYRDQPWVKIVPYALGPERRAANLYITREPACSSVYPPIDDVVDRHPRLEPQRMVRRETIELITLDDWCADNAVDNAVANSIASGVTYGVAAGNDGANACNTSPAPSAAPATGSPRALPSLPSGSSTNLAAARPPGSSPGSTG